MLSLAFSEKSLEVQRSVVIEEFKQRYLNQPYGDEWLLLRPLAYQVHPYQWATIGKEIKHIEDAHMDDVRAFFNRFYLPSNAIMVVAGDVKHDEVKRLSEKWFGPIPSGNRPNRNIQSEPIQTEARRLTVNRDVPTDSITKVYHMAARMDADYQAQDLLSDVLGRGQSARLFNALVKDEQLFTDVSAHVSGSFDKGLFVINGRVKNGVDPELAEAGIQRVIDELLANGIPEQELIKVKNKAESTHVFGEVSIFNKTMNLAFGELLGDIEMVNTEIAKLHAVTAADVLKQAQNILREENCSTLFYLKSA
jgi:predicted Zn-dependent peptidase